MTLGEHIDRRAWLANALLLPLGPLIRPRGLHRCSFCGELRGEGFVTTAAPQRRVRVRCRCENDTLCRRCGRPLAERRVGSHYWSEADGRIWHVPGFAALAHRCVSRRLPEGG